MKKRFQQHSTEKPAYKAENIVALARHLHTLIQIVLLYYRNHHFEILIYPKYSKTRDIHRYKMYINLGIF